MLKGVGDEVCVQPGLWDGYSMLKSVGDDGTYQDRATMNRLSLRAPRAAT